MFYFKICFWNKNCLFEFWPRGAGQWGYQTALEDPSDSSVTSTESHWILPQELLICSQDSASVMGFKGHEFWQWDNLYSNNSNNIYYIICVPNTKRYIQHSLSVLARGFWCVNRHLCPLILSQWPFLEQHSLPYGNLQHLMKLAFHINWSLYCRRKPNQLNQVSWESKVRWE